VHYLRENAARGDDGPGIEMNPQFKEGIGLANTRTRLKRCYSGAGSMSYQNREQGGLEVTLRMPLTLGQADIANDTHAHHR
jgi:sensor histidine kinase YesM